jgi:peptidoglycan/LPS O-acetylase OafA/YrhL
VTPKSKQYPQLHGLRAAAALVVVAHHLVPEAVVWDPTGGRIGPDLFFVLSGFLITRSLLQVPARSNKIEALGQFYRRRLVRIAPLHYLVLILVTLLGLDYFGGAHWWHWTFLSNVFFALRGEFVGTASHLWTLAVEQHFYLFWPLVILFVAKRFARPAALLLILSGLLYRLIGQFCEFSDVALAVGTPAAFETLGAGALLACWRQEADQAKAPHRDWIWLQRLSLSAIAGLALMVLHSVSSGITSDYLGLLTTALNRALVLIAVVGAAVYGFPGLVGRLLASPLARELSRYSFGIYLWHNFAFAGIKRWNMMIPGVPDAYAQPLLAFLVTLALAAAGYHWIEQRLLAPAKRPAHLPHPRTKVLRPTTTV